MRTHVYSNTTYKYILKVLQYKLGICYFRLSFTQSKYKHIKIKTIKINIVGKFSRKFRSLLKTKNIFNIVIQIKDHI